MTSCRHTLRSEDEERCARCVGYGGPPEGIDGPTCEDCGGCGVVPRMVRCPACQDARDALLALRQAALISFEPESIGHGLAKAIRLCVPCGGNGQVPAAEAVIELVHALGEYGIQQPDGNVIFNGACLWTHDEALRAAREGKE